MITIIDYGMGNLGSIANMIKKAGHSSIITSDLEQIKRATKLILPGVGSFDNGIKNLENSKMLAILNQKVLVEKIPILGICLGMQLMTNSSEEGTLTGLRWINAQTKKFTSDSLKIPHMGWNTIKHQKRSRLFKEMESEQRFYFVHSYFVSCDEKEDILTITNYAHDFVSSFEKGNIIGVQFHPEKSHKFGMNLIKQFAENY
jgi:glutamine amidotransferase